MGAAAERASLVDQAMTGVPEHRARAVVALRQLRATIRTQRRGGDDGFAFRHVRRATGELELAALGTAHARALDGSRVELRVN